jgi:hypothetical protein
VCQSERSEGGRTVRLGHRRTGRSGPDEHEKKERELKEYREPVYFSDFTIIPREHPHGIVESNSKNLSRIM